MAHNPSRNKNGSMNITVYSDDSDSSSRLRKRLEQAGYTIDWIYKAGSEPMVESGVNCAVGFRDINRRLLRKK